MIDTHAHLNFPQFDKDREELVEKCLDEGVLIINVGTNFDTSKLAVETSSKYEKGVYASVGLHPLNIDSEFLKKKQDYERFEKSFNIGKYKELVNLGKVVAIGETGFDFWYQPKSKEKRELLKKEQLNILNSEIDLAEELKLPLIFHCRLGFDELSLVVKQRKCSGVVHCFTGNYDQAKAFLDLGCFIGINGIIFKMDLKKVIEKMPLDMMLVETDCPFLSPPNFEERNNPLAVKEIIKEIARVRKIDFNIVEEQTTKNASNLFNI